MQQSLRGKSRNHAQNCSTEPWSVLSALIATFAAAPSHLFRPPWLVREGLPATESATASPTPRRPAGRGRGATLPAWMTRPGGGDPSTGAAAAAAPDAAAQSVRAAAETASALARHIMSSASGPASSGMASVYSSQHQPQAAPARPSSVGQFGQLGGAYGAPQYSASVAASAAGGRFAPQQQLAPQQSHAAFSAGALASFVPATAAAPAPSPAPASAAAGQWTAHTSPDGRAYYYHSGTKESTFVKVGMRGGWG